jgi:cysteine-rich repeat protein
MKTYKREWSAAGVLVALGLAACSSTATSSKESIGSARAALAIPQTGGFVIVSGDDADDTGGHCQGNKCGGLYGALLKQAMLKSLSGGAGILAIGVNGGEALIGLSSWNDVANGGPGALITHARTDVEIAAANLASYAVVYIPSDSFNTVGGLTPAQSAALNARKPDIVNFVNVKGGSLMALTQADVAGGWGFLPVPLTSTDETFTNANPTPELVSLSPNTTPANLSHTNGAFFHNVFTGPPGYSGLSVLAVRADTGQPVILGGARVILTAEVCTDGLDNDGDGLTDREDPDCQICGDGVRDPKEECDDGNRVNGDGCSDTCKIENHPPIAACKNVTACADAACVASADINNGSSDLDGDPLTFLQSPGVPYALGSTTVMLTVSDGKAQSACTGNVTVNDCTPPTIACPAAITLECANGGAAFTPGAATATDNCVTPAVNGPAAGTLPLGSTTLTYTATDAAGNRSSCTTTASVVDTTPPVVSASKEVRIWPPNHKYVEVSLDDCAAAITDACSGALTLASSGARIVSVSSDEPVNANGDGNTTGDIALVDALHVNLRAERSGGGDGRVYNITFAASDSSGNRSTAVCRVVVPHDANHASAVDSGPAYTVVAP